MALILQVYLSSYSGQWYPPLGFSYSPGGDYLHGRYIREPSVISTSDRHIDLTHRNRSVAHPSSHVTVLNRDLTMQFDMGLIWSVDPGGGRTCQIATAGFQNVHRNIVDLVWASHMHAWGDGDQSEWILSKGPCFTSAGTVLPESGVGRR